MSYNPNTWNTGDVITADKLNNIEQGIVNAGGAQTLIVRISNLPDKNNTSTTPTLDKTFDEIYSVVSGGGTILLSVDQQSVDQQSTHNLISSCKYRRGTYPFTNETNAQYVTLISEDIEINRGVISIIRILITANKYSGESTDVSWMGSYEAIELTSNS